MNEENSAKDMVADFGTDTVVIDFLERSLTNLAQKEKGLDNAKTCRTFTPTKPRILQIKL